MDVSQGLVFAAQGLVPVGAESATLVVDDSPILHPGALCLALTIPEGGSLTLLYQVPLSAKTDLAGGEGVCLGFWDALPKPIVWGFASQGLGSGRS